jgi:ABC-type phosphate/phosphonate transport system permease subunit
VFNFNSYVHLRYVLLINVIAALAPSAIIKGRANDPLLRATWWKVDQHSAVLVVALAGILGSTLVLVATRKKLREWWAFVGCGVFAGDFPATFYLAAAPGGTSLPLTEMYMVGTFCGVIAGIVLNALLGDRKPSAAA